MVINLSLKNTSYPIIIEKNVLNRINDFYSFSHKKVLIITDSNIPSSYINSLKEVINNTFVYVIEPGEASKSFTNYIKINEYLLKEKFSRNDVIISLGGGVTLDLGGFIASTYKRGIDLINIPTSTLSMIDSSIGGKNAINLDNIKNVVGTFYQPKLVLIDVNLLNSLDKRNYLNGLFEAIKMGYIYDKEIINLIDDYESNIESIIIKSLLGKKHFVEIDELELNERKILNYGHTLGHALESYYSPKLLHGEAIALGMVFVSENKEKLISLLQKLNLKFNEKLDIDKLLEIIKNDKKVNNDNIDLIVTHSNIGQIKKVKLDEIKKILIEGEKYVRCFR